MLRKYINTSEYVRCVVSEVDRPKHSRDAGENEERETRNHSLFLVSVSMVMLYTKLSVTYIYMQPYLTFIYKKHNVKYIHVHVNGIQFPPKVLGQN